MPRRAWLARLRQPICATDEKAGKAPREAAKAARTGVALWLRLRLCGPCTWRRRLAAARAWLLQNRWLAAVGAAHRLLVSLAGFRTGLAARRLVGSKAAAPLRRHLGGAHRSPVRGRRSCCRRRGARVLAALARRLHCHRRPARLGNEAAMRLREWCPPSISTPRRDRNMSTTAYEVVASARFGLLHFITSSRELASANAVFTPTGGDSTRRRASRRSGCRCRGHAPLGLSKPWRRRERNSRVPLHCCADEKSCRDCKSS